MPVHELREGDPEDGVEGGGGGGPGDRYKAQGSGHMGQRSLLTRLGHQVGRSTVLGPDRAQPLAGKSNP